jgi:hypothetical protein
LKKKQNSQHKMKELKNRLGQIRLKEIDILGAI